VIQATPIQVYAWGTLPAVTSELFPVASAEFKLSITRALADQLADALSRLRPAPLAAERLDDLQNRPGVYELFVHGKRVYVGKASKDLPKRLRNHLSKLSGRANIDLQDVSFLCLYVDEDLEAAAPETLLIKNYRQSGEVPWNTNGFGNKDPGRNRDHSVVKAKHFDTFYPIDLDQKIDTIAGGTYEIRDYLAAVKANLPYLLRFETNLRQLADISVDVPSEPVTASDLLRLAVAALPEGWQATALPGYAILYREESVYRSALVMWRKRNGVVQEIEGERAVSRRAVDDSDAVAAIEDEADDQA
jgi:hypothetical protein